MSLDVTPTTWLGAGYTLSSHKVCLNDNDASSDKVLTKLSDANANASTGDIRVVAFALCEAFRIAWAARVAAGADQIPDALQIAVADRTSGNGIARTISFTFKLDDSAAGLVVRVEP